MSTLLTVRAPLLFLVPPILGTAKPSLPCWRREQQSTSPTSGAARPCSFSAQKGHVEILKLLIEAKGDVNQRDKVDGASPLMVASCDGFVEAVELLLLNGADVHHKDKNGLTALDCSILFKQPSVEAVIRAHIAKLEADPEAARK